MSGEPRINSIQALLQKSRDAAESAVGSYNNPGTAFRAQSFVVLAIIVWNSALLAKMLRDGPDPYERQNAKIKIRADGRPQILGTEKLIRKVLERPNDPVRNNLELIISLRHDIEHAFCPPLDEELYGYFQAMMINLDAFLSKHFGKHNGLRAVLPFSLQMSGKRTPEQNEAWKKGYGAEFTRLMGLVSDHRDKVPEGVWEDPRFKYRVFLVPALANKERQADVAVEFVPYDPEDPEFDKKLEKISAILKPHRQSVPDQESLLPKAVCEEVRERTGYKFSHHHHHAVCWRHFKVRPSALAQPKKCNTEFCYWHRPTKSYLYTPARVDFLVENLSSEEGWRVVFKAAPELIGS